MNTRVLFMLEMNMPDVWFSPSMNQLALMGEEC